MLSPLLAALEFRSSNAAFRPVIDALDLLARYAQVDGKRRFYGPEARAPLDGVVPAAWRDAVVDGQGRVDRIPYELCLLVALRDAIRRREIHIEGAASRGSACPSSTPCPSRPMLDALKAEVARRWGTLDLLNVLEESEFLTGYTREFQSVASREAIDRETLRRRLLLCLFALGTNIGIRGIVATGEHRQSEAALRHVRRHYINRDNLRRAIAAVANATFAARDRAWWGEGTASASDSTQFGSWESNLMTEWHQRYGGPGVMIYWHVERDNVCIYSQLKTCSSSEVAAMIEGLLRHCTTAEIEANYTDTHGASIIGFAFCELLGFRLLPRLKRRSRSGHPSAE